MRKVGVVAEKNKYIKEIHLLHINSRQPSSGCRGCFPLSAATTPGLRLGVALPPTSPLSRACPLRRADPLRATCQLLPDSHCGIVDQRPWTDRPLLGGCGKVTSRPWQFQWVTKANLHMSYCWRCPLGVCNLYLLLSDPRTWPGVSSGTRLSQAGT